MAMTSFQALANSVLKSFLAATDGANLAPARVSVDASLVPVGTSSNPIYVTGSTSSGTQAVSLASLPALSAGSAMIGAVSVTGTVSVTGAFQTTQPVSAATLPLPAGAATAAKQPALGTAGTAAADVLTIQGIVGGTPLPVSGSFSATTAAQYNATPPTLTSGTSGPLQTDVNGKLLVSGSFSATTAGQYNSTLPTVASGASGPLQTDANGRLLVGNFPATQAVSASALPLPTGAATAAKQPALGTAGTASADVLTVQGAASMTALKTDGSAVTQPVRVAASSIATAQVSVTTTATLLAAARAGRQSVTIIQEGTTLVRVGASGVTTSTGIPLPGTAYSSLNIDGAAAVYGIVAAGSQTVSVIECF